DRAGETISVDDLPALAQPGRELTYTIVPRGTGLRIGIDRDADGFFDRTELELGSDPASADSVPGNTAPVIRPVADLLIAGGDALDLRVSAADAQSPPQKLSFTLEGGLPPGMVIDPQTGA